MRETRKHTHWRSMSPLTDLDRDRSVPTSSWCCPKAGCSIIWSEPWYHLQSKCQVLYKGGSLTGLSRRQHHKKTVSSPCQHLGPVGFFDIFTIEVCRMIWLTALHPDNPERTACSQSPALQGYRIPLNTCGISLNMLFVVEWPTQPHWLTWEKCWLKKLDAPNGSVWTSRWPAGCSSSVWFFHMPLWSLSVKLRTC